MGSSPTGPTFWSYSVNVPGGFTKLLTHVERTCVSDEIITFSDNTVSDGKLYSQNGFTEVKNLPPDYSYIVNGQREHKFKYRLTKFKNDDTLTYEDGLTEKQLAELNNLPRIWDAGKTKWVKLLG